MDDVGTSFFHMLCSAVLFITAVMCLIVGISGVTASITICQELLSDEVAYETSEQSEERFVSGLYVVSYLMSESRYVVCIKQENSAVTIQKEENMVQRLMPEGIKLESLFQVSYVHGIYGDIRLVCFTQVEV